MGKPITEFPASTVGMYRSDEHLYWWNGQGPYTSITTALKLYDKSDALVGWAKKETAAYALRNLDTLVAHRQHNTPVPECDPCAANAKRRKPVGRDDAARMWVSAISDYQRDTAADLGTDVHRVAEGVGNGLDEDRALADAVAYAASVGRDVDAATLRPFAAQYQRFIDEKRPQFLAIEYMGLNTEHGYAGTGDIIARLDFVNPERFAGAPALRPQNVAIDIKTHTKETPIPNDYYPETAMQLAACSRFEFVGRENDATEYALPRVDAHAVLLLGRDDYRLIPYAVTDATFDAFLACLRLHAWKTGEAKSIVGRVA